MSETLFDFSKKISDQEFVTHEKVKNIIDSINIDKILCKKVQDVLFQNFVLTFPKKDLFFTVTLYGGGTSGMKLSYDSKVALGGYSSGTIIRYPIEIKNTAGNIFAVVRIGKGGESFGIDEKALFNNGEYSSFDLYSGMDESSYKTERGRKEIEIDSSGVVTTDSSGGATLLEGLSSYGSGRLLDGTIIDEVSTQSYFGFRGSNPTNTTSNSYYGEHRNYYAPYLSQYDGYHSMNGLGGDHSGDVDGEEDTGAGGAGVFNNSSKRVGKGGNGGCILEYEGSDKIKMFATNYQRINSGKLSFDIQDSTGASRINTMEIPRGIYSIGYLLQYIKSSLNLTVDANVILKDSRLLIKMDQPWNINLENSDEEFVNNLGIANKDIFDNNQPQIAKFIDGSYQKHFRNSILSVCEMSNLGLEPLYG
jgi:hypothetical protein